ncbi:MAG: hypothetical protein Q4P05_04395 [Actinomycetaceae bacterium]|nr:hypothetical protein [Actinomycetaceae bacterium]
MTNSQVYSFYATIALRNVPLDYLIIEIFPTWTTVAALEGKPLVDGFPKADDSGCDDSYPATCCFSILRDLLYP